MTDSTINADRVRDVIVIGAGVTGIYAVRRALQDRKDVICLEAGGEVGGTWYFNRYPGARCDVESVDYSYSFDDDLQEEWEWSERYATQPELLSYLKHVVERFGLAPYITLNTTVHTAHFDENNSLWVVGTGRGETYHARHILMATGSLSAPIKPDIPGVDDFAGEVYFTAQWPHAEPSFEGKRVGVIGTGSSGVQSIPVIAESAAHVTVFQRTANYSVPAHNRPLTEEEQVEVRSTYAERRAKSFASGGGSPYVADDRDALKLDEEELSAALEAKWKEGGVLFGKVFADQVVKVEVNDLAREFAERKIREKVDDPQLAADLIPTDHPLGTKRICTDSGYFETFNRDHVTLVNLRREPIERMTAAAIETGGGNYELDVLIFATGFDALTGALNAIDIRGTEGKSFVEAWTDGPLTYLGMQVPGFPNLFILNGAGSTAVFANMMLTAEHQVTWIFDLIREGGEGAITEIEPRQDAAEAWTGHVQEVADATLLTRANSWYRGANVEGKEQAFMLYAGGFNNYIRICAEVADEGYKGLVFSTR